MMRRRNPPRQASREYRRSLYNEALGHSPPNPGSQLGTSSLSTNRKRTRNEPSTQQSAKRQSNIEASSNSQISPSTCSEGSPGAHQRDVAHPVVSTNATDQVIVDITRRIEEYRSRLQTLENEHKALSQDRDPDTVCGMKKTLSDTTTLRKKTAAKLNKVKEVIRQMARTINDCHDVVPEQLYQALKASRADHRSYEDQLRKAEHLETKQTQQLKDAERKYAEAGSKIEGFRKQMNKCKLNLRVAEKDLNNVLLQRRLNDLSRVNVSGLPYDQRVLLSELAEQMAAVLKGESRTSDA